MGNLPSERDLQIREAVDADLDGVVRLLHACIADMRRRGIEQWDEIYPTRETFASDIRAAALYVAVDGAERTIGTVTIDEHQNREYAQVAWAFVGARTAVVHRVMVDPRRQGRGIAGDLMAFAERRASTLGFDVIRLDAFTLNPAALRLYQKLGYRDAGTVLLRKGVFRCFEKRLPYPPIVFGHK